MGGRGSMWTKNAVQPLLPHSDSNFPLGLKSEGQIPSIAEEHAIDVSEPSIPDLVRRNAILSPDSLALRAGSDRLTYQELDFRSNQLAQYLSGLGVRPGSVVGLYLKRSV